MPDLDHLRIDGTTYDLKDSTAREKDAVQDTELSQLKSAFDTVDNTIFDITEINSVPCSQIPGATMKNGSSARSTSYITIDALTTYDSYYKVVTEPTTIWFEDTSSAYVSICVGENYTQSTIPSENVLRLYCSNSVRYRKSENNLPTKENPVTVPAGGVFVVTVTTGGNDLVYGIVHSVTRQVSSEFAEELEGLSGVAVTMDAASVKIIGTKYEVLFEKKTTAQGYQWNITRLSNPGGSNVLPTSTDIIGPIQYDGENNFMGGVHGNESNIEFGLWSGGKRITESGTYKLTKMDGEAETHLKLLSQELSRYLMRQGCSDGTEMMLILLCVILGQ